MREAGSRGLIVGVNGAGITLIGCISRAQLESGERKSALLRPGVDRRGGFGHAI